MTKRKVHRTVIQVEVLSEDPYTIDDLEQVNDDITNGDCSGKVTVITKDKVDGKTMAELLENQASDPSFFRLTEDGEDR